MPSSCQILATPLFLIIKIENMFWTLSAPVNWVLPFVMKSSTDWYIYADCCQPGVCMTAWRKYRAPSSRHCCCVAMQNPDWLRSSGADKDINLRQSMTTHIHRAIKLPSITRLDFCRYGNSLTIQYCLSRCQPAFACSLNQPENQPQK